MTSHAIGTREEWLAARLELLEAEKAYTRQGDALAERRQALPWVKVEKDYLFETEQGDASLVDLFQGRSQLLVYHFMFGPDYTAGCPSCSAIADGFNGSTTHLANHDVMLWAISRAPLDKLLAFRERMGWSFPWASAGQTDFNFDYNVSVTEMQERTQGIDYNFRHQPKFEWRTTGNEIERSLAGMSGVDVPTYHRDRPGMSAFIRENGAIYHTYSSYSRGVDGVWGMYAWLDRAPKGRNEAQGPWWLHRDRYAARQAAS
jgi:predicted dithiol-disulfide oxidoreductase (DUF899 family)